MNAIRWDTLESPEYQEALAYYKGLIAFRKAHEGLRQTGREAVQASVFPVETGNPKAVCYRVEDRYHSILAIFNADDQPLTMTLPDGTWDVNIHDGAAGTVPLFTAQGQVTALPCSAKKSR